MTSSAEFFEDVIKRCTMPQESKSRMTDKEQDITGGSWRRGSVLKNKEEEAVGIV